MSDVVNVPEQQSTRDGWLLICVAVAAFCLMAALFAAGLAFRASDDASRAANGARLA